MTTFSPVTEQEMSDFLSRASATVREYANLSTTLDQMRAEMEHLRTGLADTRAENDKLRGDINAASDLASQAEAERDEVKRKLQDEQGRSAHLTDLITARDSRVQELSKAYDEEKTKSSGLDRECSNLNSRVASLEDQLTHTSDRRDYWQGMAKDNLSRADKAEGELAKLEKMLADIGFHRPKVEEVKTEAPPTPFVQPQTMAEVSTGVTQDQTSNPPEMKPVTFDHGPEMEPENKGYEEIKF